MLDFTFLRSICATSTAFSKKIIDDFLIPYAAQRENLVREMDARFTRFRKVVQALQPGWVNFFKAQYIAHRIFKSEGLIKKYLNHAALKELNPEERRFLNEQASVAWRFSFSIITGMPEIDFYEMEDVFSGEAFLLYSPSVSRTLNEGGVSLWFNLIGFNGHCWQSFGPVIGFRCFDRDDIFFFATELNPKIETEQTLMADVELNPIPYMMLISGSNYPSTAKDEDEVLHLVAEYPLSDFDSNTFKEEFQIEYAQDVFRLKLRNWEEFPHFATAYFVENEHSLLLTAMTNRGFTALAHALNKYGLKISAEADIRLHLPMTICIKEILGKELQLNPYERLFERKPMPSEKENLSRLNRFLSLALPFINDGQEPDVAALAQEAGVDEDTAREILGQMIGRIGKLQEDAGKKGKNRKR